MIIKLFKKIKFLVNSHEIKQYKIFSPMLKLNNNNILNQNYENKTNVDSIYTNYATQKLNLSNYSIDNNYNFQYLP